MWSVPAEILLKFVAVKYDEFVVDGIGLSNYILAAIRMNLMQKSINNLSASQWKT